MIRDKKALSAKLRSTTVLGAIAISGATLWISSYAVRDSGQVELVTLSNQLKDISSSVAMRGANTYDVFAQDMRFMTMRLSQGFNRPETVPFRTAEKNPEIPTTAQPEIVPATQDQDEEIVLVALDGDTSDTSLSIVKQSGAGIVPVGDRGGDLTYYLRELEFGMPTLVQADDAKEQGTGPDIAQRRPEITEMHFSALTVELESFEPRFVEPVSSVDEKSLVIPKIENLDIGNMDSEQLEMVLALIAAIDDPSIAQDYIRARMSKTAPTPTAPVVEASRAPGIPSISSPGEIPEPEMSDPVDLSPEMSLSVNGWQAFKASSGEIMVSRGSSAMGGIAVRTGMVLGDLGRVEGVTQHDGEVQVFTSSGEVIFGGVDGDASGPIVVDAEEFSREMGLLEQLSD